MTTKVSDGLRLVSHDDDQFALRRAFGRFPTGVSVHAAEIDGIQHALVASSFMVGVSLDPPLVAVAVQQNSETWPLLRDADRFGVSVFAAGQGALVRQLAGKDRATRFDDVAVERGEHGALFLTAASSWFEVSLHEEFRAGDHLMGLLRVHRVATADERDPLVWHGSGFRDLAALGSVDLG